MKKSTETLLQGIKYVEFEIFTAVKIQVKVL